MPTTCQGLRRNMLASSCTFSRTKCAITPSPIARRSRCVGSGGARGPAPVAGSVGEAVQPLHALGRLPAAGELDEPVLEAPAVPHLVGGARRQPAPADDDRDVIADPLD